MKSVAITFACYNQASYTQACLESMVSAGDDLSQLVVVDNQSTDHTLDLLSTFPIGTVLKNSGNLGCGVAWDQGILAHQSEWSVVMNNDVLVSPGWLEGLISAAESNQLRIASPAMIEGPNDYDFHNLVSGFYNKTAKFVRPGLKHAVCVAIHRSVFQEIGYFQANPRLLGFEDTLFFSAADRAGIRSGIIGGSWIHHFGSITQKAMKEERGLRSSDGLGDPRNKHLLGLNWWQRKLRKRSRKLLERRYREREFATTGMSLHGLRDEGGFNWI